MESEKHCIKLVHCSLIVFFFFYAYSIRFRGSLICIRQHRLLEIQLESTETRLILYVEQKEKDYSMRIVSPEVMLKNKNLEENSVDIINLFSFKHYVNL